MADVYGDLGGQPIELNNAATEATLKQLLAAMTAMAKAQGKDKKFEQELDKELQKLAKQAEEQGKLNADAIKKAKEKKKSDEDEEKRSKKKKDIEEADLKRSAAKKEADEKLKKAQENVADKFVAVGREVMNLALGTSKLVGVMAGVEDSVSKATAALGSIPIVGGLIAGILGPAADAAEKVYDSFKKVSAVGANFSGSFSSMINSASAAGLTMDQYTAIVAKNAQSLAAFGGSTQEGAKKLLEMGKSIQNSGLSSELLKMGYSTEDVNNGMAQYVGMMSKSGKLNGMTNDQLAKSAGNYLKEMDGLAKLTGESREEKQKEREALMKDAQLRAAMQNMSVTEQDAVLNQIQMMPKQHQAAIKDMIATGNMTSDAAIKFAAMMPESAGKFMQMGRTLEAGGKITKEAMNSNYKSYLGEADVAAKRNAGLVKFNREFDNEYAGIVEAQGRQKDGTDKVAKEQEELAKQGKSSAEAMGKFKQDIAKQGNAFTDALQNAFINSGGMEAVKKAFAALSKFTMDYVVPAMTMLFKGINFVVDLFSGPVMSKITGFVLALAPLAAAIFGAIGAVKALMAVGGTLGGVFSGLLATVSTAASGLVAGLMALAWPITLAVAAVTAVWLIMKYFNKDLTELWHIISDYVMDAFTSISDFLVDTFAPAFEVISDLIEDVVMPAFSAVADFLKDVFMAVVGKVSDYFEFMLGVYKKIGEYIGDKLSPIFNFLGEKVGMVTGWFKDMYNKMLHFARGFGSLGDVTTYLGNLFKEFSLFIKEMTLGLRDKLSWLPGITAPSTEEREALEAEKKELMENKRDAEIEREKLAQRRDQEAADKQKEREKERENRDKAEAARRKKRDDDYAKEKADKEKKAVDDKASAEAEASKAPGVDYSSPEAMLKSFKEQQAGKTAPGTITQPTAPAPAAPSGPSAPGKPLSQDQSKNMAMIEESLKKQGITDPKYIAAVKGNVMKETGGKNTSENLNYGNTSNDRIKSIFGSRATGKSDAELNDIKKDPTKMGEMMYGKDTKIGQQMGNTEAGDGFKYRGRGFIQLTGKSNYAQASKAIYGDDRLVKNPDMLDDPQVAADVSAWYMKKGKSAMAKQMGMDENNMNQEQANLLATSQVAGRDVRSGSAYLKGEVMNKVNTYAAQFTNGAPVTANGQPPTPATAAGSPSAKTSAPMPNSQTVVDDKAKKEAAEKEAKTKADAEKKAKDDAKKSGTPAPGAPAQESAETLLASLNMKMDKLIQVNIKTAELNDKQLSVQKGLSSDMYA